MVQLWKNQQNKYDKYLLHWGHKHLGTNLHLRCKVLTDLWQIQLLDVWEGRYHYASIKKYENMARLYFQVSYTGRLTGRIESINQLFSIFDLTVITVIPFTNKEPIASMYGIFTCIYHKKPTKFWIQQNEFGLNLQPEIQGTQKTNFKNHGSHS